QVQAYSRTRDVDQEFPGSRGFGYIERVPKAHAEDYLARARADGAPDFNIKQLTPHDDERFVIRYIEPLEINRQAQGLDIGSESNRRNAAWQALRNNEATITAPITLVQATGATLRSFLLLLPVYDPRLPISSPQEREAAGLGWAYTPLVTDEVLASLNLKDEALRFSMQDVTDAANPEVFYTQEKLGAAPFLPGLTTAYQRRVFGREWRIEFHAYPGFVSQLNLLPPSTVGTIGALVSALLAGLQALWLVTRQRRREVAETNALLAAIVESASDAIISESMDGNVLSWNRAAENMFGLSREQAIGQPLGRLLLPPERQREDKDMLQMASEQGTTTPFETTRLHQEGHPIDISMTVSAIRDAGGRMKGAAKLLRDISERKQHEQNLLRLNAELENRVQERTQALDEARRFLVTVLDSVPLMIAYIRQDGRCRVANQAFANALGMAPEQVSGTAWQTLLPQAVHQAVAPEITRALSGETRQFEFTMPQSGEERDRELSTQLIPDLNDDRVGGVYLIAQDVSELNSQRRKLEQSVKEQRDERLRLQSIIQGTGAGTWEWHVPTGALRINEEWARQLGYTLSELEPTSLQTWVEHMHPDDLLAARERIDRHFAGELPHFETENRMRHRDGGWVWVLSRGQVITRDEQGKPEWMFGTHLDIQRRKMAEERLRDSEMFLERVGKVAGVGGWRLGLADRSLTWTNQTRVISGVNPDYTPDLATAMDFYPQEVQPVLNEAIQTTIDTGQPFDLELPYITAQGEHRWVRSVGEAEYDPSSKATAPVALVGALMDFTERHATAESLKRAQIEAEAANHSKSVFLANMSHEIRTPLNAVLGVFYLLADTRLDANQRRLLSKAQLAGRSLLGIVNDVLDLAKIESGELLLTNEPYVLADLLGELESIYEPQATKKQIAFRLKIDDQLPPWLIGDAQRVRQILTNLVGNALKFTETGHIELSATRHTKGNAQWLTLRVKDTGLGIPQEVQDKLFKPFIQADATTTRQFGGTGLGLSIVRQLSEAMGGHAGLLSQPGEGSEFWVELPLREATKESQTGAGVLTEPLEVVVVDDNQSDRAAMASLVRSLGWRATELASGQALIDHFTDRVNTGAGTPDALLVDWHMPGLNGLEALDLLAQRIGHRELPAALVVSIHDRERIEDLTHSFVADKVLTKPLEVSTLFNAISESIVEREGDTTKLLQNTKLVDLHAQWLTSATVLLVDDSEINLEIAQRLLEKYSAKVLTASNGLQALEVLESHLGQIDVVLMDIQMPVMDGLEATRRIRQASDFSKIPVIALTAGALVQEREKALKAGMNDFLTKPLEAESLIRCVRRHVELARGTALPMVRAIRPQKHNTHWPQVQGIDAESAAVRLDNDVRLFARMLGWIDTDFADIAALDSRDTVAALMTEEASRNALRERLHKLRGSAGTIGAKQVHAMATLAEAALSNRDGEEVELVLALSEALRQLVKASQPVVAESLEKAATMAAESAGEAAPAGQETLLALAALLRSQDFQALNMLEQHKGALAAALGPDTFLAMSNAMEMLDFPRALSLLEKSFRF
ncbi:MAG TPA: PAS domain S-box protein, partial [Hydrogenophaga sp.]